MRSVHPRAIRRTKTGYTVADGVIFPILSAMSLFVRKDASTAARDQLSAHDGNPMNMGRNA
jgi:hypothetical protein